MKVKSLERKNVDSHIILYAKYWYKRTDVITDMKVLVGERCARDPERVSISNIVSVLTTITYPFMNTKDNFESFLRDCFRRSENYPSSKIANPIISPLENLKFGVKEIIESMLAILGSILVYDDNHNEIVKLDEPDYSILPKRPEEK
jgi:hypothetical protein